MPSYDVKECKNDRKAQKKDGITFHRFPSKESMRQKWTEIIRKQRSDPYWMPSRHSRVCSQHFHEKAKYLTAKGIAKLNRTAVPVLKMSSRDAGTVRSKAPETFPWQDSDSSDQELTNGDGPSVSRLEQCRFCGDFSKTCLHIDNKPYVNNNKTEFTLNGVCVNLDFSNDHLPKTICTDCDVKLQELTDFINVVKAAQDSLINVTDEGNQEDKSKESEVDNTLVIKTEHESPTPEQVDANDDLRVDDDTNDAEVIKVAEDTIKSNFNNKRKVIGVDRKLKKAKVSKRQSKNEDSLDSEVNNDEKLNFIVEETVEIGSTIIQKKPKVNKDGLDEIYIEINVKEEIIENNDICDVKEESVSNNKNLT